jgi:hypothetical protein
MLEKLHAVAAEKYVDDAQAQADFVVGFVKAAMTTRARNSTPTGGGTRTIGTSLQVGFGKALGEGVGGILMAAGIQSVGSLAGIVNNNNLHTKFLISLEKVIATNRIVKEANKNKVREYAETMFKFAPNVATDPNLLSSVLANAIQGESIDPMTIKTLTELEGRYKDNTTFSPKSYT